MVQIDPVISEKIF